MLREETAAEETEPAEYEIYGPSVLPEGILATGEVPLFQSRPLLWVRLVGPIAATILSIVACALAYSHFPAHEWILYILAGVIFLGLLSIGLRVLRWRYTVYAATNRRVLRQTGIVGKDYMDCPLDKIQTVYLRVPVLGRLFGFGTIRMATAGSAWIELHWEDVRQPRRAQRIVNEILERYRKGQPTV